MKATFLASIIGSLILLSSTCSAQTNDFSLLPTCAQRCFNETYTLQSCQPLPSSGSSCACEDKQRLNEAKACLSTACSRKDTITALSVITEACNEDIPDKSVSYRNLILAFYILALVALAAQWVARISVGRLSWLDDGNMVLVLLVNTLLFGVCYRMSWTGLGRHIWNVPAPKITETLLFFWISEIAYFTALGFIKISFLLFYLQIFPEKRFRRIVSGTICFQVLSMIAFGFAAVFVCSPVNYAWLQWDGEHEGKCINNNTLAFTHAGHSILLDFVALSLPFTQIWKLQLGLKKKIGVLLMFSVGSFVTVVSIIRLRSLVHFANTTDMTWDYLEASLWSVLECQVGIICACMPAMRLGLTRLFPKLLGSSAQAYSRDAYGTTSRSKRSQANTFNGLTSNAGEISVQTTFKVSHARKAQPQDDERSFVQLVEIDADTKSAGSVHS
ncbi:hypothetical protein ACN47E_009581 [Coniothyrium glycines]